MRLGRNVFAGISAIAMMVLSASQAGASVIQIGENAFQAGAGEITFSEFNIGTVNPTYTPADYGGVSNPSAPTVTFGGYFTGQQAGATNPGACPAGAAVTGCVLGNPTATLSLDPNSPTTFITTDSAQPNSPVLSGSPRFNGSIAILFSKPQAGVGLDGGYFDSVGSTAITAFDINGNVIGSVKNSVTGIEFLGLVTSDKSATIAGLEFSLVGDEPAGFDIDSVRFGVGASITVPGVPLPPALPMFGAALLTFGAVGYAMKRKETTSA